MKFIKNLARPLLLDFAGALKKTLTETCLGQSEGIERDATTGRNQSVTKPGYH